MRTLRNILTFSVAALLGWQLSAQSETGISASGGLVITTVHAMDISGKVTDQDGSPLKGVSISVLGLRFVSTSTLKLEQLEAAPRRIAATTNSSGKYKLRVDNNQILVFELRGYETQYVAAQAAKTVRLRSVTKKTGTKAEKKFITGVVSDELGILSGATVTWVDKDGRTIDGVSTDMKGKFSLTVPQDQTDLKLSISFVGYKTRVFNYTGQTSLDVTLTQDKINRRQKNIGTPKAENTDEDFGRDKETIGYATETVDVSQSQEMGTTSVEEMLIGKIAGLDIIGDEDPSKVASTVRIRGISHIDNLGQARIGIGYATGAGMPHPAPAQNSEEYGHFRENRFVNVGKDPLSTFSLEVDGASYSNVRRMLNQGQKPPKDAVRVEEFLNYFSYDYPKPAGKDPVRINYDVGDCPWNGQNKLVRIGVKAKEFSGNLPASNFVFLVDVSGSMSGTRKLELVKSSLKLLVNNLRDEDRVAIVTYANNVNIPLPSTGGGDKQKIRDVLNSLRASGGTAGGDGIQKAYEIAQKHLIENGNNRIILCTDGDFNIGVSKPEDLERLIEEKRKSGVFLSVLGYGMGNYKDNRMQVLAEKGNGNYAYIDNIQEANRVLVNEFGSSMYTVAKDVKLQVEFNPANVEAYRLIGYESRVLAHEDFNDDNKDAGELGAGHTVTAMYEIVPKGVKGGAGSIDPLRYQQTKAQPAGISDKNGELMNIKLRYKEPDGDESKLIEVPVRYTVMNQPSADFRFASAVALFGQLLKGSDFTGKATYDDVLSEARKGLQNDEYGYRREFVRLVESAKGME